MTAYANLEIGLHRRRADCYSVELRFSRPEDDAEVRLARGEASESGAKDESTRDAPPLLRFDRERLRELLPDPAAYGRELGKSLLAGEVKTAFAKALIEAQTLHVPLRLRLFIGPSAPELHSLRWETLRHPVDEYQLCTSERIVFSRYLSSVDWRPVGPRSQADLKALVAIANPADLDKLELAPVDVDGELERARAGLGDIPVTPLDSGGSVNLNNLVAKLRDGYDVLYLVCHGKLVNDEPQIWLEDEEGNADAVTGSKLVTRLQEMQHQPRLVILASCQSAGTGKEAPSDDCGALAALGPRLAEAGVPAVIAMQGSVTMQTVAKFMTVFFSELQRDGQIDRAVAAARGAVRDRPDWWMPVLFMRLKSGRLWYAPGFAEGRDMIKWPSLLRDIEEGACTPIIGPGLTEWLLGSRRKIARRWAETHHFPMMDHDRDNLPQVAQYLAIYQSSAYLRDELEDYVCSEVQAQAEADLPGDECQEPLDELISIVGARRRQQDPAEPHQVLAHLPLPIYVTANYSNMLAHALTEAGKEPKVVCCRWKEALAGLPPVCDDEPSYRPTKERPLIYHLFGNLQERSSIVLTEDDYFDYLISVTRDKALIPRVVHTALASTALLFLGFRMNDWDFRVLFRTLKYQEGNALRDEHHHVAVQIDPEEGRILDPERARRYLESYFEKGADVKIYWGRAEDFVGELSQRWEERIRER